jgi:hypothetical protein
MMKRLANMQKMPKAEERVTTFTNKDENDIKYKFMSLNGGQRMRQSINMKFVKRESIIRQQEVRHHSFISSNT